MAYEKVEGRTPNGGVYSEIYYMNDDGELTEKETATKCVIRECDEDGTLISEVFGACNL